MTMRSGSRRAGITALCLLAAATVTSACGSSGSSASTGSTGSSAQQASAGQAGNGAGVSAARSAVAGYTQEPTKIGLSVPLTSRPPAGKTIVFLRCELPQCGQFADGIQSAAAAVGWNDKVIAFQTADPSSLISAFTQALQYHPTAVSLAGIPQQEWQSVIPQYAAAGIPIIPLAIGTATLSSTVIANVLTDNDYSKLGAVSADWFIATSNGTGHALVVNVPTYDVLSAFTQGVISTVAGSCPGCKTQRLDLALSQVAGNTVNAAVTSALQKDPSIKYVITSNGPFVTGLASALVAAGISGVKIAGSTPSISDEQGLLNGTESAFTGENYSYESWLVLDAALRHMEGLTIPADEGGSPIWLLTKGNVGTPSPQMDAPVGYQDQFKKLWQLSS